MSDVRRISQFVFLMKKIKSFTYCLTVFSKQTRAGGPGSCRISPQELSGDCPVGSRGLELPMRPEALILKRCKAVTHSPQGVWTNFYQKVFTHMGNKGGYGPPSSTFTNSSSIDKDLE